MAQQLTFDLPVRTALGRGDFFVSPSNAVAVAALADWAAWPRRNVLLVGPAGSGKTHLAHVWAHEAGAKVMSCSELTARAPVELAEERLLVVEDAHCLAAEPAGEAALFHLHNLLQDNGGYLLMTANQPPKFWQLQLPDLLSRMQALPVVTLEPPDDSLLAALLVKLFADRQLDVTPNLIPYVVSRMERSYLGALALVQALDQRGLQEKRAISRVMAAEVLDKLAQAKA